MLLEKSAQDKNSRFLPETCRFTANATEALSCFAQFYRDDSFAADSRGDVSDESGG